MSEHSAEKDAGLWMYGDSVAQTIGGRPCSGNRRPLDTHDRHLKATAAHRARGIDDDFLQQTHLDHGEDAWCDVCGCCWCCDEDCCAEYICSNEDCGCSEKPTVVIDITGGPLSPGERAIHGKYQSDDPDGDYYDTAPVDKP